MPKFDPTHIALFILAILILAGVFAASLAYVFTRDKETFIDKRSRIYNRDLLLTEVRYPRGDAFPLLVYPIDASKQYNCISSASFTWMTKRYILMATMNNEPAILLHIPIGSTKLAAEKAILNIANPNAQINALLNVDNDFILAARDDGLWKLTWNGLSFNGERVMPATIGDDLVTVGLMISEPTIAHETKLYSSFAVNPIGLLQHYGYGSIDSTAISEEFIRLDINEFKTVMRSHLNAAGKRITIRRTCFGTPFANEPDEVIGAEYATGLATTIDPLAKPDKRRLNEIFDRKSNVSESSNIVVARQERVNLTRKKVEMIATFNPAKKRYYFIEMNNIQPFGNNRLPYDRISDYFMEKKAIGSLMVNMRDVDFNDIQMSGRALTAFARPMQTSILCVYMPDLAWIEYKAKRYWSPQRPAYSWHLAII